MVIANADLIQTKLQMSNCSHEFEEQKAKGTALFKSVRIEYAQEKKNWAYEWFVQLSEFRRVCRERESTSQSRPPHKAIYFSSALTASCLCGFLLF